MKVNEIIAKAYQDFALSENPDMIKVTELLEKIRTQLNLKNPLETWERLKIDLTGHEMLMPGFIELFRSYYASYYKDNEVDIINTLRKSKQKGVDKWYRMYADGIIYYRSEFKVPLCKNIFLLPKNIFPELLEYRKLNRLILESRWIDAHPILEKLLLKPQLSTFQKSSLLVLIGLIELYHFPGWKHSMKRFKRAKKIYPNNIRAERAEVEYMIRDNRVAEAKNAMLALIAKHPNAYANYNLLAYCYKEEGNLTAAEQWYFDAIKIHSLQTESWSSLIRLYSDKKWYKEKKKKIPDLIQKIKKLEVFPEFDNEYYNSFREQADGMILNEDYQKVPLIYNSAIQHNPRFITAYLDFANFYLLRKDYKRAEGILNKIRKKDPGCFDLHWALSYLYESKEGKFKEAISAYKKCLEIRPAWSDQIYNLMANLYSQQKDFETAVNYYKNAIKLNKENDIYKDNLGELADKIILTDFKSMDFKKADGLINSISKYVKNKDVLNRIGNFYFRQTNYEKAIQYYDRAILLDNNVAVFYENKGLAFEGLINDELALENFKKACNLEQKSGDPFNSLGYFYFRRKEYAKATEYYLKAIEKEGNDETFIQNLIRSYGDSGDFVKAEEWNKKLIKLNKTNADHIAQLAFYQSSLNNGKEALRTIKKAYLLNSQSNYVIRTMASIYEKEGNSKKAFELYKKVYKQDPHDDTTLNRLGVYYYRSKNYKEAIKYYSRAIAINNTSGVYYDNLGLAYEFTNNISKSEDCYKKFISLEPQNSNAYNNLAVSQFKQGKNLEAEKNYLKALEIDPGSEIYLENLAILYRAMQKNDKAIVFFERALKINKDSHFNHNDVGVLYYTRNDFEKAIEHYEEAIRIKPEISLYHENLGLAFKGIKRRSEEKKSYEKALSLEPENARLLNRIGVWYFEDKNYPEAIKYYHQALALDSNNATFLENLGLVLFSDGDDSNDLEAIEVYKKLVTIAPANFNAWNELGVLYYSKGMNDEAIDAYMKANMLRPATAVVLENIGLAFFAKKYYTDAILYYLQAIKAGSNLKLRLLQEIGDIYHLKLNKSIEAIPFYKDGLILEPTNTGILKKLVEVFGSVNDIENARKTRIELERLSSLKN